MIGHDHLMDFPGGADFNIAWEPVIVLFTNKEAANEHVLTDTRIEELVASGDAIEVPAPDADLHLFVGPSDDLRPRNADCSVRP